jgi:hypothetical protein
MKFIVDIPFPVFTTHKSQQPYGEDERMAQNEAKSRVSQLWERLRQFGKEHPQVFVYFHIVLFVTFVYLLVARPVTIALIESRGDHNKYLAESRAEMENDLEKLALELELETSYRANEDLLAQIRVMNEEIAAYEREKEQRKTDIDLVVLGFRKFLEITSTSNTLSDELDQVYVEERILDEAVGGK